MKSSLRAGLSIGLVGSLFAFAGCGNDDDASTSNAGSGNVGGAADGAIECQVLGELCHEADTGSGPAHDCHETGHIGNAAACVKDFSSCIHVCVTDVDDLGAGGAASAPDPRCLALGELCHEVDDQTGPLHTCHETGHIGDAAKCATAFDSCSTQCLAARAALQTGAGGGGATGGMQGVGGAGCDADAPSGLGGAAGSGGAATTQAGAGGA